MIAMVASAALAERFKDLGFRVIEGGRSTKRVVVDSLVLAEKFGKQHAHVLREIDQQIDKIKSHAPDLEHQICTHFRQEHYTDRRGKKWRYYLLTEIGYEQVAVGWDDVLRFQYILAFHELEEELGLRARAITRDVVNRLQELRGDWVQPELELGDKPSLDDFAADTASSRADDGDGDDTIARGQWALNREPQPTPSMDREAWEELEAGVTYAITLRMKDGRPFMLRILPVGIESATVRAMVPIDDGQVLVCITPIVPLAVILRAHPFPPLGRKTLENLFD